MNIGDKYLITTRGWFFAPDGKQYKAVFGTLKKFVSNGSFLIGCMRIDKSEARCVIKTDSFDRGESEIDFVHDGSVIIDKVPCRIYDADQIGSKKAVLIDMNNC